MANAPARRPEWERRAAPMSISAPRSSPAATAATTPTTAPSAPRSPSPTEATSSRPAAHRHVPGQLAARQDFLADPARQHDLLRDARSGSGGKPDRGRRPGAGSLLAGLHDAVLGQRRARRHRRALGVHPSRRHLSRFARRHRAGAGDLHQQAEQATGETIDHYVAIGGGAASDLWCQILADATARPVSPLHDGRSLVARRRDGGGERLRMVPDARRLIGGNGGRDHAHLRAGSQAQRALR